jgi:hypothetical protein
MPEASLSSMNRGSGRNANLPARRSAPRERCSRNHASAEDLCCQRRMLISGCMRAAGLDAVVQLVIAGCDCLLARAGGCSATRLGDDRGAHAAGWQGSRRRDLHR